jgi:hypothetical protein
LSFPGIDSISEPHPNYESLLLGCFNNTIDTDKIDAIIANKAKNVKSQRPTFLGLTLASGSHNKGDFNNGRTD